MNNSKEVDILKGPLIFYWRSASIVLCSTHVHIICTLQSLEVQYSRVESKISKNIKRNLRPGKYDLEDCYREFDCYINISISCNVFLAFSYWLHQMKRVLQNNKINKITKSQKNFFFKFHKITCFIFQFDAKCCWNAVMHAH